MKINFTKKEYRLLLHMVYIAEWVMNSHNIESDNEATPYKDLEQKIMSYAKEFGYESLIEFSKDLGSYYPTKKFDEEEPQIKFIEEFEENVFWDRLADRLSMRDLIDQIGAEKINEMDRFEAFVKQGEISDEYNEEFEINGIKYLKLQK